METFHFQTSDCIVSCWHKDKVNESHWPINASIQYHPQENITAHEVAQILNIFMRYHAGAYYSEEKFNGLPDEVKKHLSYQNPPVYNWNWEVKP